ncbi:MAG TPA: sterol desaturase family protein [Burkholderiales bacterium]|nr:sterol desaturase family protein [Burkholderiales bacterium]
MSAHEFIAGYEGALRIGAFAAVFGLMALWEWLAPARRRLYPRLRRWSNNLALLALDVVVLRLLFPAAAIGVAMLAEANGAGLLRVWNLPPWIAFVAGVVLLDLTIYLQHLLFHAVPALWRLHRVHHADPDFDVTTGLRFHPFEIVLSMLIKTAAIFAFGPPVLAVLIFEVLLNALAVFNHGNVRLPSRLERVVRWFVVTPDMHRVHHSKIVRETNSNYGFNLSVWDRIFGTYRDEPALGHAGMRIGVAGLENPRRSVRLVGLLTLPFMAAPHGPDRRGEGHEGPAHS